MKTSKTRNGKLRRLYQSGWRGRMDSTWRKLARKLKRANEKDPKKQDKEQQVFRPSKAKGSQ